MFSVQFSFLSSFFLSLNDRRVNTKCQEQRIMQLVVPMTWLSQWTAPHHRLTSPTEPRRILVQGKHSGTYACEGTCLNSNNETNMYWDARTYWYTHPHTHTCAHMCMHTHTHTHTLTHSHTHTHTHTCTHTLVIHVKAKVKVACLTSVAQQVYCLLTWVDGVKNSLIVGD